MSERAGAGDAPPSHPVRADLAADPLIHDGIKPTPTGSPSTVGFASVNMSSSGSTFIDLDWRSFRYTSPSAMSAITGSGWHTIKIDKRRSSVGPSNLGRCGGW